MNWYKSAAWYENGRPVNINPSRWEGDKGIGHRGTGSRTKDEIKEQGWGKKQKSDKKKHKVDCPCGKKCKCDGKCKCQKS